MSPSPTLLRRTWMGHLALGKAFLCTALVSGLLLIAALLAEPASAQAPRTTAPKSPSSGNSSPPPSASVTSISLATLAQADRSTPRTLVQLRRFVERGNAVSVREELIVAANGTADPVFSLRFLGVEGEAPGSPNWATWSQNYTRYAALYFRHGSFRVRNLARASANYSLHDLGPSQRAGRSTQRLVVFPARPEKSIWLLDVDIATAVVLYAAEFDSQLRLLSEVEALSFAPTAVVTQPNVPSMVVTAIANLDAARSLMPGATLVDPPLQNLPEYALGLAQIVDNPLNGRRSVVLAYNDGVDEFFVVQSPGTSDFFAGMPSQQKTSAAQPNTIARTRDTLLTSLLFWHSGTSFRIEGRGGMRRLDELGKQMYRAAILGG